MTGFTRADRSALGRWFWTIDRVLLGLLFLLIAVGLVAVLAASPAAAFRNSSQTERLPDLYFFSRQLVWLSLGLPLLLLTSMASIPFLRRMCVIGFVVLLFALILLPFLGDDTKGATRWFFLFHFKFQPSELIKPVFVVLTAWLLSIRFDDQKTPALLVSFCALLAVVSLLVIQPDFGQTALVSTTWLMQAALAGMSLWRLGSIVALGVGGLGIAYLSVPHVHDRIERFLTGQGDTYQIDKALESFKRGGLFGAGPGEGHVKMQLPEPHTDYIFAVFGEEFGMIACLFLSLLYLGIVVRVVIQTLDEDRPFVFLASMGLSLQFGIQAFVNMAVNLHLLPSKGMTLPFISYGGSSLLASAFAMGMVLAFTRGNPFLKESPFLESRLVR